LVLRPTSPGVGKIETRFDFSNIKAEVGKNSNFATRVFELYRLFNLSINNISDIQVFHHADSFQKAIEIAHGFNNSHSEDQGVLRLQTYLAMIKISQYTADLALSKFIGQTADLVLLTEDRKWLFDYHKDSKAYYHEDDIRNKTAELKKRKVINDEVEMKIVQAYHTIFDLTSASTLLMTDTGENDNFWNQWMFMKKPDVFINLAGYLWLELTANTRLRKKFQDKDWEPLAQIIHGMGIAESFPAAEETEEARTMTSTGFSLLMDSLSDVFFVKNLEPLFSKIDYSKKDGLIKNIDPLKKLEFLNFLLENNFEDTVYENPIFIELLEAVGFESFFKTLAEVWKQKRVSVEYGFKSSLRTFLSDWEKGIRNYREQLLDLDSQSKDIPNSKLIHALTKAKIKKFPEKATDPKLFKASPIDFFRFRLYFEEEDFNLLISSLSTGKPNFNIPILAGNNSISPVHFYVSQGNEHIDLAEIADPLSEIKKRFREKNFSMFVIRYPIGDKDNNIFVEIQLFPKSLQRNVHRSRNAYVGSRFSSEEVK